MAATLIAKPGEEIAEPSAKALKRKPPPILFPAAIERQYVTDLRREMKQLYALIETNLIANLETLLTAGQREQGVRTDAMDEDLKRHIDGIRIEFGRRLTDDEIKQITKKRAGETAAFNKKQNDKVWKTVLDVDVFRSEPWLGAVVDSFAAENAALIRSLETNVLKDVQEIVFRAVRQGWGIQETSKLIRERFGVGTSRADLIATDQIGKLNGQLSMLRQTELGVRRYRWRTARDIRVREEHKTREGQVFHWNRPPYDGHPGEPIRCRCYPEPMLEDLIGE